MFCVVRLDKEMFCFMSGQNYVCCMSGQRYVLCCTSGQNDVVCCMSGQSDVLCCMSGQSLYLHDTYMFPVVAAPIRIAHNTANHPTERNQDIVFILNSSISN
jgi:hypothetical protein